MERKENNDSKELEQKNLGKDVEKRGRRREGKEEEEKEKTFV